MDILEHPVAAGGCSRPGPGCRDVVVRAPQGRPEDHFFWPPPACAKRKPVLPRLVALACVRQSRAFSCLFCSRPTRPTVYLCVTYVDFSCFLSCFLSVKCISHLPYIFLSHLRAFLFLSCEFFSDRIYFSITLNLSVTTDCCISSSPVLFLLGFSSPFPLLSILLRPNETSLPLLFLCAFLSFLRVHL